MTADQARTLPYSLDAERSVLGAVLIDNEAMNDALAVLQREQFYRDAHKRIFQSMVRLHEAKRPIDYISVKEDLERAGDLEDVGGPAYVASLTDGVPRSTNVEYYAQIVRDKATLRA